MLRTALVLALAIGPVAPMAIAEELKHELDQERTVVVPLEQKRLSAHLPQTLIIREDTRDPSKIEVAHVKDHVPAGQKVEHMTFEKMALNSEVRGISYDTGNELDVTSSTNSWGFGLALGALGLGVVAGSAWSNRAYGYGYGGDSYYYTPRSYSRSYDYAPRTYYAPRAYVAPSYTYASYRPYYNYGGYRYSYVPYDQYSNGYYRYTYCNWPASYYN